MAVIPGPLKIHILQIFNHALRQNKQGSKHNGGKNNGKDSDNIPCSVCFETAVYQCADN